MTAKHSIKFSVALALAALLCGAGPGAAFADDAAWTHFLVAPGKFILFSCRALDEQTRANQKRILELESLMASSGSEFANAIAYKPEYLQLRGEQADIQRETAAKKCKTPPGAGASRRVNGAIIR
jgi:hypothetical protein